VAEWGLYQCVAAVVTDNAANMKAAVEKLGWRRQSCFADSINLIVQSGLVSIAGSPVLKLKQDSPTR